MPRNVVLRFCLVCCIALAGIAVVANHVLAQRGRSSTRTTRTTVPAPQATPTPRPQPVENREPTLEPEPDPQDVDTVRTNTNLVVVPVVATTREGNYIPDLRQDEFSVFENGAKQEVAFFATVSAPFHVVLLLDTSGSTKEKLGMIREAASVFVDQLQRADLVKVISFDEQVRDLNEFTNDRALLKSAINKTTSGAGTKLYDAFEVALSSIKAIKGRKAIVLFSDGVDFYSERATFDGNIRWLDEESVIVYPIRYDTRRDTARIMREQIEEQQGPVLPTIGVINAPPRGTTAPTFPSDDPNTVPTSGQGKQTGPFGLPPASEILRRRRESEREDRRDRDGEYPTRRMPMPDEPDTRPRNDPGYPRRDTRREDESLERMLDQLYLTADSYLLELANKSGGRVLRADTLQSLPDAFAKIAAELRTQYAIGYYPSDKSRDGSYRKIKVSTTRKNIAVRARPGYRAPSGG